jgi:uncharacterized protein
LPDLYANRVYRIEHKSRELTTFTVTVKETNLFIQAKADLSKVAVDTVLSLRHNLESYIKLRPEFLTSLKPIDSDRFAPEIAKEMIEDSRSVGTGPMAAVAGAIAERVALAISNVADAGDKKMVDGKDVIVENGGDVFIVTTGERVIGIYSGDFLFDLGIKISAKELGISGVGVSSSSAVLGESLSLGNCELATVVAKRGALSDAAATALGNRVKSAKDIEDVLGEIVDISDVIGGLVIIDGKMGIKGEITLVALDD